MPRKKKLETNLVEVKSPYPFNCWHWANGDAEITIYHRRLPDLTPEQINWLLQKAINAIFRDFDGAI